MSGSQSDLVVTGMIAVDGHNIQNFSLTIRSPFGLIGIPEKGRMNADLQDFREWGVHSGQVIPRYGASSPRY